MTKFFAEYLQYAMEKDFHVTLFCKNVSLNGRIRHLGEDYIKLSSPKSDFEFNIVPLNSIITVLSSEVQNDTY